MAAGSENDSTINALFDELDRDHNGVITHEDLDRLQGVLPENLAAALRSRLGPRSRSPSPSPAYSASMPPAVFDPAHDPSADEPLPLPRGAQAATSPPATGFVPPTTQPGTPPRFGTPPIPAVEGPFISTVNAPATIGIPISTAPHNSPTMAPSTGPFASQPPSVPTVAVAPGTTMPVSALADIGRVPRTTALPPGSPTGSLVYTPLPPAGAHPAVPSLETAPTPPPPPPPPPLDQNHNNMGATEGKMAASQQASYVTEAPTASPRIMTPPTPPLPVTAPPPPPSPPVVQALSTAGPHSAAAPATAPSPATAAAPPVEEHVVPAVAAAAVAAHAPVAAAPASPPVEGTAVKATPEEIFKLLDKNNDGLVTRQEFQRALEQYRAGLIVTSPPEVNNQVSTEASGPMKVEIQVGETLEGMDPSGEELFLYRDLDGELTGSGGEVFALIDKNDDGVITRDEFLLAFAGNRRIGLRGEDEGEDYMEGGLHWDGFGGPDVNMHGGTWNMEGEYPNGGWVDGHFHPGHFNVNGPDVDIGGPHWKPPHWEGGEFEGPDFKGPHWEGDLKGPDWEGGLGGNIDLNSPNVDLPEVEIQAPKFGCFQRFLANCEWCIDSCEHLCCIPCLYQCAVFCGFNIKAAEHESIMERLTPWLFTLLCIALFAMPVWLTFQLSQDMQVRYWISDRLSIVLCLPALFLVAQWYHAKKCTLSRVMVCTCLVGSCIFLLFLGDLVLLSSYRTSNALLSDDCSTDLEKQKLQIQWNNAELFYTECMAQTAADTGASLEAAYGLYRIQDCDGYSDHLEMNPAWPYLGAVEENYNCGGWCTRSQPLWTFKSVKDSCSTTVADILYNKVQWSMLLVLVYTVVVLAFVSIGIIQAGPILRSHGVAWKH